MFRSIRAKLTLWYIGVLALVFSVFAVATYTLSVRVIQEETTINLSEMADNFVKSVNQLQTEMPHNFPVEGLLAEVLEEFQFRDYRFAIYNQNNELLGKTLDVDLSPESITSIDKGKNSNLIIGDEEYLAFERPFVVDGKQFKLIVVFPLADQIAVEDRIRNIFLVIVPVLLLIAGGLGYFLARKSLQPIAEMGERAKQIGAENLHERLPVANRKDEIGNLAVLFNQLLDRLDEEFDRQRRFMADASHELRTPLAIVRGESEVALQKNDRTPDEYLESLRIVNDEGRRLSKIVEDMFTLARVDAGNIQANFREVYLDEIVNDCVRKIRTLADQKSIGISFSGEETKSYGDEALLQRLFLNLLDNAVKYNIPNGSISVVVVNGHVEVRNTGPEIPEEKREMIFERFFRVDKAHSRQADTLTSGAGLGLSIAKWIADLHGATIQFSRSNEGENIFFVSFPN